MGIPVVVSEPGAPQVTPLALEQLNVTCVAAGVLQPVKVELPAFAVMVKWLGLAVVLNETVVVPGEPVTETSGSVEVNVIEFGVTDPFETAATNGSKPTVITMPIARINRVVLRIVAFNLLQIAISN
jgi:hypothetical protein